MKKLTRLPVCRQARPAGMVLPIFLSLLFLMFSSSVSAGPDLSGTWSGFGYSFKASQTGSSITLTATDGDISGKVSLEGTITGNTLEGRQILVAKSCPNLEKYVPAKGTISSDGSSITVTYKNSDYDPSRCVDLPGSQSEETGSYTKVSSPPAKAAPPKPEVKEVQTNPEPGSKITCSEVWKIAGSENCERFVVSNDEGGLWCNLPDTRESLQPWIYGPASSYTFTPGTCSVESLDQPAENPAEKSTPFNIFAFNPLETWRNIQGLLNIPEGLNSLVQTAEILSGPKEIKIQVPEPSISTDSEGKLWNFLPGYIPQKEGKIDIISGQGQIKPPGSDQFISVINTGSSDMITYSFFDSTFKNSGNDVTQFNYIWDTNSGAVINVFPQTEVQFGKPVSGDASKESKRKIFLDKGEIEVKVKNTNPENKFEVQTEILDLIVIGTHFWISHDPDKKQTVAGVYKGKVEVKTKDGKKTTITPDGDKPGVVVVARKLSVVKLAIVGLVLAAVIGVVVFFLKKKFFNKGFSKKKK